MKKVSLDALDYYSASLICSLFVTTYEKSVRHQNLDAKNINLNLQDYKLIQTQIFSKNKHYLDATTARMRKK